MYIFGRDLNYRPALIFDLEATVALQAREGNDNILTAENVTIALAFLQNYLLKVMCLDGHVDQWIGIFNFG
jgi:hypothetical protein